MARRARRTSAKTKSPARKGAARKSVQRSSRSAAAGAARASGSSLRTNSHLMARDIACFRDLLLKKRAELVGDVATLRDEALSKDKSGNLSNMPIHMADLGSDNYEQEFTLGLIESERELLREIDEALERMEKGTYGVCAATGRPIGKARLKAKPWAKYCYEYVLEQERARTRGS